MMLVRPGGMCVSPGPSDTLWKAVGVSYGRLAVRCMHIFVPPCGTAYPYTIGHTARGGYGSRGNGYDAAFGEVMVPKRKWWLVRIPVVDISYHVGCSIRGNKGPIQILKYNINVYAC